MVFGILNAHNNNEKGTLGNLVLGDSTKLSMEIRWKMDVFIVFDCQLDEIERKNTKAVVINSGCSGYTAFDE